MKSEHQITQPNSKQHVDLRINALLAEYTSLRKESVSAIGYRVQIVSFTFASLSIIVAGLLTRNVPDLLAGIMALFVVPQIAKLSLLMWLGEYQRSIRAGRYLREIEAKINQLLNEKTVGWETQLIGEQRHMGYPYVATAFFILGLGYLSSALGIYFLFCAGASGINLRWMVIVFTYVALLEGVFFGYFCQLWHRVRTP